MYIYIKSKLQTATDHRRTLVRLDDKNVVYGVVAVSLELHGWLCDPVQVIMCISENDSSLLKGNNALFEGYTRI